MQITEIVKNPNSHHKKEALKIKLHINLLLKCVQLVFTRQSYKICSFTGNDRLKVLCECAYKSDLNRCYLRN